MSGLRATPFHARTAAANRDNAWVTRNGVTLSERFDSVEPEVLAARLNAAIADISWRWRIRIEGAAAETFLSRLVTRDAAALAPGRSFKALWLSDAGGVRGAGIIARFGRETFEIVASAPDVEWIASAAGGFDVRLRDVSSETGGLAIVGPYASATLITAELAPDIEPLAFRKLSWRGLDVTLSRWGEHGGYEIWCEPDDAILVWDRLMRAGREFGIVAAGVAAMDTLDLEAGIARPNLDYRPAREAGAAEPAPGSLGLGTLIDEAHQGFNGRRAFLASQPLNRLVGIEIESAEPAPFTPLMLEDKQVGHTLRSAYSPTLRRAIALASVDAAAVGTVFSLTLPPGFATPSLRKVAARIVPLPFVAAPASIGE